MCPYRNFLPENVAGNGKNSLSILMGWAIIKCEWLHSRKRLADFLSGAFYGPMGGNVLFNEENRIFWCLAALPKGVVWKMDMHTQLEKLSEAVAVYADSPARRLSAAIL